jgi:hypothetical protein
MHLFGQQDADGFALVALLFPESCVHDVCSAASACRSPRRCNDDKQIRGLPTPRAAIPEKRPCSYRAASPWCEHGGLGSTLPISQQVRLSEVLIGMDGCGCQPT